MPVLAADLVQLFTSDRYVCEATEIQGPGSRWREVEDTRLEARASVINRDYDGAAIPFVLDSNTRASWQRPMRGG